MKSTLWKLTALAGVMGAGFLVVYQAQTNLASRMSGAKAPADEEDFTAPETFQTLASSESTTTSGSVASDEWPSRPELPPPQQDEPGLSSQSEPTVGLAVENVAKSKNPFAGGPESLTSLSAGPPKQSAADDFNPFANDHRSVDDTRSVEETPIEPAFGDDGSFAGVSERSGPKVAFAASVNPFAEDSTLLPESPALPETNPTPIERRTDALLVSAESGPLEAPEPDRAPLTRLSPDDSGPGLVAPPIDATVPQRRLSFDDEDADSPAGLASLSSPGPTAPQPHADDSFLVAQASNERPTDDAGGPNPFLVLPGAATSPPSLPPNRSFEQNSFPPPTGSRAEPEPDKASVLPDFGSSTPPRQQNFDAPGNGVEMKIRTRTRDSEDPFSEEPPAQLPKQTEDDDSNRFGASPPVDRQVPSRFTDDPPVFGSGQAPERPAADTRILPNLREPNLPALAPANTPRIQPFGGAESPRPNAADGHLGEEDLRGIGTVETDSPVGTQQAQVTIEKTAPADAVIGKPLVYQIHVRNIGRSLAENVIVKDVTPKGSRLVGTVPQAELNEVNSMLIWRLGKMAPGQQETIKIKVIPTEAGQIGSIAKVSFEAAVASRTVITAPELKLTMQGPDEVPVGEEAVYRFTLTNPGSADAHGVYIRNKIPPGFEHPNGDDLEYEIGTIPKGQSRNVDLTLRAVEPGQHLNWAALSADGNVSVETEKMVTVLASRLTVHRQGPADRFVGRSARFTNTVTNESRVPLQDVTVVETIPVGVRFEAASEGGRFDPQRRTVTWQVPRLDPGERRQVQVIFIPEQAADHSSTIRAFDARGNAAEATSQLRVAGFSSLRVDVAHAGTPIPIGEEVALRLTIRNRGTAAANQVKTIVEIPPQMKFVDAKGPIRYRLVGTNLIEFEAINSLGIDGEQQFDIVLSAIQNGDAHVRVELRADELTSPLNQEELVVIHPDQE